ncbi:transcriptional regulator [Enterococcus florum]|uniref:Transcriptional regulator n=1 Tax=Enterococcus florum TaxID=2480627 RepID=A0A4P5PCZ4_9ENTE|nr:MerR family transcriptional regulator [Enterococcus florum]GCF94191.1 transcriptional regulator [Enterococcus florum]
MWTIQEFSKLTSISPASLRYYDKRDILPSKRRENGYRVYDEQDLLIIKNVMVMKYADFSLEDIRTMTSLYYQPEGQECNDQANQVLQQHVAEMKERIRMWTEIVAVIEGIQPLLANHELYKLNREQLDAQIDQLFQQIDVHKLTRKGRD